MDENANKMLLVNANISTLLSYELFYTYACTTFAFNQFEDLFLRTDQV